MRAWLELRLPEPLTRVQEREARQRLSASLPCVHYPITKSSSDYMRLDDQDKAALRALDDDVEIDDSGEVATVTGEMSVEFLALPMTAVISSGS